MNETYTKEQLEFLQNNRKLMTASELTSAFNTQFSTHKTPGAIKRFCNKRQWYANSSGKFVKGYKPWNTGTKGLMKANKTSFKQGDYNRKNEPKLIGYERKHGLSGYTFIKIANPNKWKLKQVYLWELKNGLLPKGFIVRFKDGDNTNFALENMEAIDRKLHLKLNLNGYKQADKEIKPLIRILSQVEVSLFEQRTRSHNG